MKTTLAICLLSILMPSLARSAQYYPLLELTGIDQTGRLAWTNRVCAPQPIHEVQRAGSLAGPWARVALVTNETSITLTNPLSGTTGAAFYRVLWSGGAPLVFDYAFDEGFGFTSVTGRLSLTLYDDATSGMGTWTCQRTPSAVSSRHPIGFGSRMEGGYFIDLDDSAKVQAIFYMRGTTEEAGTVVMQGTLYRGEVAGRCLYTRMTGTVYEYIFHEIWEPIGTFTATRAP